MLVLSHIKRDAMKQVPFSFRSHSRFVLHFRRDHTCEMQTQTDCPVSERWFTIYEKFLEISGGK